MQAVGAKADHQLLRLHRQALILQAALMTQPVRLPPAGVGHQLLKFSLRQRQHQILDRGQGLEQIGIEARAREASCLASSSRAS